jgi:hypothetical protein
MPLVITTGATVTCAHQGTVKLQAGQELLLAGGKPVLVRGDLDSASVSGCTTPLNTTTGTKPCQLVVAVSTGVARRLAVAGKPVLLDTASGTTDGVTTPPTNTWSVQSAGQATLKAS